MGHFQEVVHGIIANTIEWLIVLFYLYALCSQRIWVADNQKQKNTILKNNKPKCNVNWINGNIQTINNRQNHAPASFRPLSHYVLLLCYMEPKNFSCLLESLEWRNGLDRHGNGISKHGGNSQECQLSEYHQDSYVGETQRQLTQDSPIENPVQSHIEL